ELISVRHFWFSFFVHVAFIGRFNVQMGVPSEFLLCHGLLGWSFFVNNAPSAEFIFGKQRGIQRNFIPIGQSVPRFNAETLVLEVAIESFLGDFERNSETIR